MQPSTPQVPLSRVEIDDEIRSRVMAAVESGKYILGPECKAFEAELAAYFGRKHCVVVSNATSGLQLALTAHGIGPGDEVLVPSHTAFPTIEAVFNAGAVPVFLDIDETATLDPSWIEPRITPRTKAIVPVHLYGRPCDLDAVLDIAKRRGLRVVEDCAQSHGARWRGKKVGSFGDSAVLSFYPSKNLPVLGDGGAVLTDDAATAADLRMHRDHGRREKLTHEIVGYNMRFNDLQAAVGRVFLRRLDANNDVRRRIAGAYREAFAGLPLRLPGDAAHIHHVYHLFVVRTADRDGLARHLSQDGIQTGIHYPVPTHRQPGTLERREVRRETLPVTDAWCGEILSLPVFPSMRDDEVRHVIASVRRHFGGSAPTA
jgi:dTDP-4-amino-4,6-dideoxygalactose transaminase